MKVLVLGGLGMLGHRLYLTLKESHETRFTFRKAKTALELNFIKNEEGNFYENIDLSSMQNLEKVITDFNPDMVINCVGIIQKSVINSTPEIAYGINSVLPHKIAALGLKHNFKLIHISTDCVFSGKEGNYTEESPINPSGTYGITKQLGEVDYLENTLTIRTSIIGRELGNSKSLVEWFINETEVGGYENVFYSGLPTYTLSKLINEEILNRPELSGIINIGSHPVSKLDLLKFINDEFNLSKKVNRTKGPDLNMHLNCSSFEKITKKETPKWEELTQDLLIADPLYDK
ncbi:hypothetical protein A9Q84_05175 [Halobacteriovorax marinus]|uniref:dTDP-4-dehydrorhamnose reductase n=1 Tax=Halobacteriovorax marinus TaxID=97084 RepID=A0A1Y5FB76_9BACT|nr:hypothetical protein A9Q84_05175 [Halobacteriovorax marinus]